MSGATTGIHTQRARRDLDEAIVDPDWCRDLIVWVMDSGRFSEYALARNLGINRVTTGPDRGNDDDGSDSSGDSDCDGGSGEGYCDDEA